MIEFIKRFTPYIDQMLVSGGSFLTIAICAHKLALAEQGKLAYVLALYVVTLLIQGSLIHTWAAVQFPRRNNQHRYQQSLVLLSIVLAILSSTMICAAMYWLAISAGWAATTKTLFLLFVFLLLQQLVDFSRKAAYYAHSQEMALRISSTMYPLRIVLLLVDTVSTINDVLLILIISCVLPLMFMRYLSVKRVYPLKQLIRLSRQHINGASQLGITAIINWLWYNAPVFFLGALHGVEAVAVVTSLRSVSNLFNVVLEVLETSFAAKLAKAYAATSSWRELVRKEYVNGLSLWLIGLVFMVLMHDAIVPIALGLKFVEYGHLMIIFWVAQVFTFLSRIEGVKLRTMGGAKLITLGNLCAFILVLLIGWPMIRRYGVNGAAYLSICSPLAVYVGQFVGHKFKWKAEINAK